MSVKLLTEHNLELSIKGGCTGSSESTLVKMPHCWKSHDTDHIMYKTTINFDYHSIRPPVRVLYSLHAGYFFMISVVF